LLVVAQNEFFFLPQIHIFSKAATKQDSSTKKMLKTSPKAKFSVSYYFVEPFLKSLLATSDQRNIEKQ
jgi:hypothetical protein